MLKFEYLLISSYINNRKEWVISYLGNELPYNYLSALFCELGSEGWELITSSSNIEGKIVNTALIPIYATTDVGVSNTSSEIFYFKRILKINPRYSDSFLDKMKYIRNLSGKKEESVNDINIDNINSKIKVLEEAYIFEFEIPKRLFENNIIDEIEYKKRIDILKKELLQKKNELLDLTKSENIVLKLEEEAEINILKQKKFLDMNLIDREEYEKEIEKIKNTLLIRKKELEIN